MEILAKAYILSVPVSLSYAIYLLRRKKNYLNDVRIIALALGIFALSPFLSSLALIVSDFTRYEITGQTPVGYDFIRGFLTIPEPNQGPDRSLLVIWTVVGYICGRLLASWTAVAYQKLEEKRSYILE